MQTEVLALLTGLFAGSALVLSIWLVTLYSTVL